MTHGAAGDVEAKQPAGILAPLLLNEMQKQERGGREQRRTIDILLTGDHELECQVGADATASGA